MATALGSGLRRSELLGLRWKDVDLVAGTLRVERTLEQTLRGGLVFKSPKTKYGRNIAALVDAPRVQAREIEILTAAEMSTVLAALQGKPLYPIVAVALGSGLRRSELLGLRWKDLDLAAGALRVEQALEQTQRSGLVFKSPKTKYGRRTVTLAPSTITILREHWEAQQEQRLLFGLGKAPEDALVFASSDGSPRSPNALTKEWQLAMRQIGLKATLHSLRHSHASTLIASGLDMLSISRRLGHGSPSITLNIYSHLLSKSDDRAAQIIEGMFARHG